MPNFKFGDEFLVNTTTENYQHSPVIEGLPNGRFVATWVDYSQSGGDVSDGAIRAQIFNADGSKFGDEFLVNTTTANSQTEPTITALATGDFVIAWTDGSQASGDTGFGVRARVFHADGTPWGADTVLPATTDNDQNMPNITGLPDGHFVAVWADANADGDLDIGIRGQVFTTDGSPASSEFHVNTTTAGAQFEPVVTALDDGHFVVAWRDGSQTGGDTSGYAIRGQVFNANGTKSGAEFLVNAITQDPQTNPVITTLANGRFVVSWSDESTYPSDSDGLSVRGQVFNANGTPSGNEFVVNTTVQGDQFHPKITALPDGNFVVSWLGTDQVYRFEHDVHAQLFTANGNAWGEEFVANIGNVSALETSLLDHTVSATADGRFVIAWEGVCEGGDDASGSAIRAQIFDARVTGIMLTGTADADDFIGTDFTDLLGGWTGDDRLDGGAGNDALYDAGGNDLLIGGTGSDRAVFTGNRADYQAILLPNGDIQLTDLRAGSPDGTNTARSIEMFQFADVNVLTEDLVGPAGHAPVVASAIADRFSPEDAPWTFQVPANTFSDQDGDPLSYSATLQNGSALPSWLSFDTATHTFTGTPPANWNGILDLKVTASDGALTASDSFRLTVTAVDDAPTVAKALPDASVAEDTRWTYQLPANTFSDQDGDPLSYSATLQNGSALPAWLSFDTATHTFTGTPPANWNGILDLKVTASDGSLSASDSFRLTVSPVDDAPTLVKALPDADVAEDTSWTYQVPDATFADVDNPKLSYAATLANGNALPPWLIFDTATRTFTGTPPHDWTGALDLKVTASDGSLTASDTFRLRVTPVDDATGVTITGTTRHDRVDATHTVKGQPLPTEYDDVIRGRAFGDHLSSLGGDDLIRGGRGRDLLDGGFGNDVIRGGRGSDFLDGGSGNDLIRGGHGRDHLDGGLGNDLLLGRFGKNFLTGGSGADTFDFNSRLRESADAHHASHFSFAKITDFVAGEDRIELSHKIFPALHVGGLNADAFLSGNGVKAAHDNDDRIIYDTKSGALYYDVDGKGGAAPIEFALLRHGPDTVSYKDFLIA